MNMNIHLGIQHIDEFLGNAIFDRFDIEHPHEHAMWSSPEKV